MRARKMEPSPHRVGGPAWRTAPRDSSAGRPRPRRSSGSGEDRRAFTLVELMVVLLILGILVSLAVGIGVLVFGSAAEKQTKTTMRVVLSAVYAYQEVGGVFPPDIDPNKPTDSNTYATSGRMLKLFLTGTAQGMSASSPGVPAAVERLRSLSGDAFGSADGGFADGWGTGIRYRSAGGFGGKPLLVSAGPDKLFGEDYRGTPQNLFIVDANQRKDNINYDGE